MPSCGRADVNAFLSQLAHYDAVFYKSLACNDHQWADGIHSHQSGVLVPRDAISFFGFAEVPNENAALDVRLRWFLGGEVYEREDVPRHGGHTSTCIRFYCEGNRNSRPESHLTCVYNPYFEGLDDGALLVIGRIPGECPIYNAIIISPDSDELLVEVGNAVGLPEAPSWGVVSLTGAEISPADDLTELLLSCARALYESARGLPTTAATGDAVWGLLSEHEEMIRRYVVCPGIGAARSPLDTALMNAPGDLIRWMHERVEFSLLRHIERWHYPPQICEAIRSEHPSYPDGWPQLSAAIGAALEPILVISKSLTQSRRSRAGQGFENHIARLLDYWNIPYERQVGAVRMDFVLCRAEANLPLSAKTSTRERWQQVPDGSYFITLDRQVGPSKLAEMVDRGIHLVVPETDKREIEHYRLSPFVIRFADLRQMVL